MTHSLSEGNHPTKPLPDENQLDYKILLSQIDHTNPDPEPYQSSSPCSSESADSYPSSNSQSPADKLSWLSLPSGPDRDLRAGDPTRPNPTDPIQPGPWVDKMFDSLVYPSDCDSTFLFPDYMDPDWFGSQVTSFDSGSNDANSERMTDSLKSQIVCAFQDSACSALDDTSFESVQGPEDRAIRPKSLAFNDSDRLQGQLVQQPQQQQQPGQPGQQGHSEMTGLLGSPSTPHELQQQLASADIAWMDALDVPNLSLEEIERILSTVNSLMSPEDESRTMFKESSKTDDKFALSSTRDAETYVDNTPDDLETSCPPGHYSYDPRKSPSLDKTHVLDDEDDNDDDDPTNNLQETSKLTALPESFDGFNSDSTLTCSEAEYYNNKIRHSNSRRTKRSYRRSRLDETSDLSSSDSESEDDLSLIDSSQSPDESEPKYRKIGWYCQTPGSQQPMSKYPSYRRVRNAQADADLEPWWPRSCPKRVSNYIQTSTVHRTRAALKNRKIVHKSGNNGSGTDMEQTSTDDAISDEEESVSEPNLAHQPKTPRLQRPMPKTGHKSSRKSRRPIRPKSGSRTVTHLAWRAQRRQKQMELWQFILCRLETGKQSAFQWVNRSSGVFRIVDTQAGAKEWGSYRNNKRMDYEKMARAMRFYYKDSILRKARQQLHFQFAMSYVEWAAKYYESVR